MRRVVVFVWHFFPKNFEEKVRNEREKKSNCSAIIRNLLCMYVRVAIFRRVSLQRHVRSAHIYFILLRCVAQTVRQLCTFFTPLFLLFQL